MEEKAKTKVEKIDKNLYKRTTPTGTVTWQAFWYAPVENPGEKPKLVGKCFGTESGARDHLALARVTKKEKTYFDRFRVKKEAVTTFNELADLYEQNFRTQKSWPTKVFIIRELRKEFGKKKLSQIAYRDLETWRNRRKATPLKSGKPRAEASVDLDLAVLAHMLERAVRWELLEVNPFKKGERLAYCPDNGRTRHLSREEMDRLFEALEQVPHLKPIVLTALHTGMRKAEVMGLRWEQVKDGFIHLAASETKTKKAKVIPYNDAVDGILREQRRANQLRSQYVFCKPDGGPYRDPRRSWRTVLKIAGIGDFRFRDLRHSFASLLVESGVDLYTTGKLLGHSDIKMTQRYAHLAPGHLRQAVSVLDNLAGIKSGIK
jgi:integrase